MGELVHLRVSVLLVLIYAGSLDILPPILRICPGGVVSGRVRLGVPPPRSNGVRAGIPIGWDRLSFQCIFVALINRLCRLRCSSLRLRFKFEFGGGRLKLTSGENVT